MDLTEACTKLGLTVPFSEKELKRAYYKEALKYHPDKNNSINSKEKFQKIYESYAFLSDYIDSHKEFTKDASYNNIFKQFIYSVMGNDANIEVIIKLLTKKYENIQRKIIHNIDKSTLLKIHEYLKEYGEDIGVSKELRDYVNKIVQEKINIEEYYILNPTLLDLQDDVLYKLELEKTFYVPLWHEEIEFDKDDSNTVIIKCVPELPEHMYIDEDNDIHVNVKLKLEDVFKKNVITIFVGKKVFDIPVKKLYIKELQMYYFKGSGISKLNRNDIYDCSKKSDVIVHIALE